MKRVLLVLALLIGATSSPVAAQTPSPAPRVELGGHLGALTVTDLDDSDSTFLWGPHVAARITGRFAVELSMDLKTSSQPSGCRSLQGLYYIAGRYSFTRPRSNGLHWFATFGGVGSFSRASWPASSYMRPDGVLLTAPAGGYSRVESLGAVAGGIGAERPLNSHVAVRVSAEAVYGGGSMVGLRLGGGLMVPIGSYRKN